MSTSEILPKSDGSFVTGADLPTRMENYCVAKVNETHVFIAGNFVNSKMAYIVNVATAPRFVFTKLPPLNVGRYSAACGVFKNYDAETSLLVAGGCCSENGYSTSEIYSVKTNSWAMGPNLPTGFYYGGYISSEENPLIIIGGLTGKYEELSELMTYQKDENQFEFLPQRLQKSRYGLVATEI